MKKSKLLGTILGVLVFIAMIAGITYAWYTWVSDDTEIAGTTGCFDINYVNGPDIGGTTTEPINMSVNYTGGKYTTVTMNIDPSCTINGKGTIYLTTNVDGTSSTILTGALKYTIVLNGTALKTGTITSTGTIPIYSDFVLNNPETIYYVYVWIDGQLADNSYLDATYSGYISASATQTA